MLRSVDSPHYHLWTDALHARHLARNASNDWDRGTYVRWTVNTAWTAFEATCEDVLHVSGLGNNFRDRLDEAFDAQKIERPDWGAGLWQRVMEVYGWRKDYIHSRVLQDRLFAQVPEAEESIDVLRSAVKDLYRRAGLPGPDWVDDDVNPLEPSNVAHATVIHAGVSQGDPTRIRVTYIYRGKEHETQILPPGTDPNPFMQDVLRNTIVPITAIRAYRGEHLLDEWLTKMRGS